MSSSGDNERLRHDIDRGRHGDKVTASDPAVAPLGTDEEAAGAAPIAPMPRDPPPRATEPHGAAARGGKRAYRSPVGIAILAIAILAIVLLAFM